MTYTYHGALAAIIDILEQVPDSELPKGRREKRGPETLLWFGGTGRNLGSAKRGDRREPSIYRDQAARQALELEATYRADCDHLWTVESDSLVNRRDLS